jgi:G:T-mismatch repair DNA endonuclease (very short patch repair protein)
MGRSIKPAERVVNRTLRRAGWRVLRIWECDLARLKAPAFIRFRRGKKGQILKRNRLMQRIQQALTKTF